MVEKKSVIKKIDQQSISIAQMISGTAGLMSKEKAKEKYENMGIPNRRNRPESGDIRMRQINKPIVQKKPDKPQPVSAMKQKRPASGVRGQSGQRPSQVYSKYVIQAPPRSLMNSNSSQKIVAFDIPKEPKTPLEHLQFQQKQQQQQKIASAKIPQKQMTKASSFINLEQKSDSKPTVIKQLSSKQLTSHYDVTKQQKAPKVNEFSNFVKQSKGMEEVEKECQRIQTANKVSKTITQEDHLQLSQSSRISTAQSATSIMSALSDTSMYESLQEANILYDPNEIVEANSTVGVLVKNNINLLQRVLKSKNKQLFTVAIDSLIETSTNYGPALNKHLPVILPLMRKRPELLVDNFKVFELIEALSDNGGNEADKILKIVWKTPTLKL